MHKHEKASPLIGEYVAVAQFSGIRSGAEKAAPCSFETLCLRAMPLALQVATVLSGHRAFDALIKDE